MTVEQSSMDQMMRETAGQTGFTPTPPWLREVGDVEHCWARFKVSIVEMSAHTGLKTKTRTWPVHVAFRPNRIRLVLLKLTTETEAIFLSLLYRPSTSG